MQVPFRCGKSSAGIQNVVVDKDKAICGLNMGSAARGRSRNDVGRLLSTREREPTDNIRHILFRKTDDFWWEMRYLRARRTTAGTLLTIFWLFGSALKFAGIGVSSVELQRMII